MTLATTLPQQKIGNTGPVVSRIGLGCMGMAGTWNPAEVGPDNIKRAIAAFEAALDAGITLFDHADIYGGTACESIFKDCLAAVPGIRSKIVIATKCGIRNGYFQLTSDYIESSAEKALSRMGIEYIDIFQMHRPDPLAHPRDTANALRKLVKSGKVLHVGVSNYYPEQVRALQTYLEEIPIVSNQIEISLLRLAPFYEGWKTHDDWSENGLIGDGVLDQCMAMDMTPMAFSPQGGSLLTGKHEASADNPRKPRIDAILAEMRTQSERLGCTPAQVALAWLLAHPSGIIPLAGSNNPDHIREAALSTSVNLSRQDWYALWTVAWGRGIP